MSVLLSKASAVTVVLGVPNAAESRFRWRFGLGKKWQAALPRDNPFQWWDSQFSNLCSASAVWAHEIIAATDVPPLSKPWPGRPFNWGRAFSMLAAIVPGSERMFCACGRSWRTRRPFFSTDLARTQMSTAGPFWKVLVYVRLKGCKIHWPFRPLICILAAFHANHIVSWNKLCCPSQSIIYLSGIVTDDQPAAKTPEARHPQTTSEKGTPGTWVRPFVTTFRLGFLGPSSWKTWQDCWPREAHLKLWMHFSHWPSFCLLLVTTNPRTPEDIPGHHWAPQGRPFTK